MKSIYHFFAKASDGRTVDGILNIEGEILDMDDYRKVKELVAAKFGLEGLTITSLTKLK